MDGPPEAASAETEVEAAPPPEPLTPERMAAENRRSDRFIAVGVIAIAFLFGLFRIADLEVWRHLKTGWFINHQGVPRSDPFSFTSADRRWVNLNWLYDWGLYQPELLETRMHVRRLADDYHRLLEDRLQLTLNDVEADSKALSDSARGQLEQAIARLRGTADTSDSYQMRLAAEELAGVAKSAGLELPPLSPSGADPYPEVRRYAEPGGAALVNLAALVVAKSLLLAGLAGMLLFIRYPGPTRWWTAVMAGFAIVAMSDWFSLSPLVLSILFLAVVLWILHQVHGGRTWAAWLLVPLEMLWVNTDSLFVLGIVVPALDLVGQVLGPQRSGAPTDSPPSRGKRTALVGAILLSVVATVANPFGIQAWSVPYERIQEMIEGKQAGLFWRAIALSFSAVNSLENMYRIIPSLAALILIVMAVASFALDWRNTSISRALILLLFLGLASLSTAYSAPAYLVAGVTLALNGQQWFLRQFGTETRITRGWLIWTQGGRAATVLCWALIAFASITGWMGAGASSQFGPGVLWERFDLETGKFLGQAKLVGRALNTTPLQGDLLIWSNYPPTQVYLDGRLALHRPERKELEQVIQVLADDDDPQSWRKLLPLMDGYLERYGIDHVILSVNSPSRPARKAYRTLAESEHWELVHLDAANAIFGRTDLPSDHRLAADAQWFREHALDLPRLAFQDNAERLPEPPVPVAPPTLIDRLWRTRHNVSNQATLAEHFIDPRLVATASPGQVLPVPPENCFLAIRAARRELARQQRVSPRGYAALSDAYFYLFNHELASVPNPDVHDMRQYELLAALNQLVTAQPDSIVGHIELGARYFALFRYIDLATEHFEAALALMPDGSAIDVMDDNGEMITISKDELRARTEQLRRAVEQIQEDLTRLGGQLTDPVARADFLASRNCPGLAIQQLAESARLDALPLLANLYLRTGQPGDLDRGAESVMRNMQAPSGQRPGMWEQSWGMLKLMQGDYEHARSFLEEAIAAIRHGMARDSLLSSSQGIVHGGLFPVALTGSKLIEDADRQARLEFYLGMVQLEAGEPMEAARHFQQALAIREDATFRGVIGFYLERITGESLPALPEPPKEDAETASEYNRDMNAAPATPGVPADAESSKD